MKNTLYFLFLLCFMFCTLHTGAQNCPSAEPVAFPGAVGYGRLAGVGQLAKTPFYVTNLNDSGPGSLRDALSESNRYIIFKVAGTITLSSTIQVNSSNIYIAGQTAFQNGGQGITIRSNGVQSRGLLEFFEDHIIVRYIRLRRGAGSDNEVNGDNISFYADHWIVDHCSVSWSTDENIDASSNSYGTVQYTISSEGLYFSTHAGSTNPSNSTYQTGHSKGGLFGYTNNPANYLTFYRNLFAHNDARNPRIASPGSTHEIVNNLMYNNRYFNIELDNKSGVMKTNVIKNLLIPGKDTRQSRFMVNAIDSENNQIYMQGNIGVHRTNDNQNEWAEVGLRSNSISQDGRSNSVFPTPFQPNYASLPAATNLEQIILSDVGANLNYDLVDQRIINDVINRTPTTAKTVQGIDANQWEGATEYYGIINDPSEVGGWPVIAPMSSPIADNDNDGIPNTWETAYNLDPNNPADALADFGNGYPNIDMFLSDITGEPIPDGSISCVANQTVAPSCNANNGEASISLTGGTAPFTYLWSDASAQTTATATGLTIGSYTVSVTDANNCMTSCTVNLTNSGGCNFSCSITETAAPTCNLNNGVLTAVTSGGTPPYSYLWNDGQTTAIATGLAAGEYSVVVTDNNNNSTTCTMTLIDGSDLSCTIEETMAPSPGGSNGVATVMASGGTPLTGDPRTDLLASPDRVGYGASATGGTNYVYVSTFNQLKTALQTAGNYVLLDPSIAETGIGFTSSISMASNTTLDGSLAPGSWLYADYSGGFPASRYMINHFSSDNNIIHSIELRGNRIYPYNGNHPSANGGAINLRGTNVWYDHITITEFWGGGVRLAQAGDLVSLSHLKIVNSNNGVVLYFPNETPKYISLFNSEISVAQKAPENEGASHFHMWNNYVHDTRFGASETGVSISSSVGQNGPVRTLSEHNVFSNNRTYAEHGFTSGGSVQLPGFIYSSGALYKNGDTTNGNVLAGSAPWIIPYSYVAMPANQVESYVASNAGKMTSSDGSGNASYTYLWNDPAQQTTAVASGLPAGTYTVTVTDGANCTTVCSIILNGACQANLANDNALTGIHSMSQNYETDGAIESSQMIINNSIVDYDSGESILLKVDFEVASGSTFHAFIDGCGGSS